MDMIKYKILHVILIYCAQQYDYYSVHKQYTALKITQTYFLTDKIKMSREDLTADRSTYNIYY